MLEGGNITLLQKSLDAMWLRQKVISNNIANGDTPGFKSSSVQFENYLKAALSQPVSNTEQLKNNIEAVQPQIVKDESESVSADGNNVDVDSQNIELVRTQIEYQYLTRMMASDISRMKYIITEGKR